MSDYVPTIGLEIHAELKTRTKMFCDSANDPDEKQPNVNVCPVCMAHPGTLPTINKEAVKHVLKVGLAVGGTLADFSEFDRKNYFYPDIPKGYQISQYKYPLVSGGELSGIALTRIHLEEDTARSIHGTGNVKLETPEYASSFKLQASSYIDFNRAGVPLMELVTEPVITSAKQAGDFARELQLLLRTLGVSDADMEKGHMRVEVNISVSKGKERGTKVEIKNLNSFRSAERAIEHEIKRQTETLLAGEKIVQETRGWDEEKQATYSQRSKESAHDYRYFPEPDLPKLKLSETPELSPEVLEGEMPELPWEKRARYKKDFGVKDEDTEMYVSDLHLAKFFEDGVKELGGDKEKIKTLSNYITSDLVGLVKKKIGPDAPISAVLDDSPLMPEELGQLIEMVSASEISSRGAKDTLAILFENGGDAREVAEKHGFLQKSNEDDLRIIVKNIIAANDKVASDFRAGKTASLQFLIGQAMRETKGSANPTVLKKLFEDNLK